MTMPWRGGLLSTLLLLSVFSVAQDKPVQTNISLPKSVSAAVPFYPELARQTGIKGAVELRVSTDGRRVSSVDAENGHRLLVDAAKENVKTWEFQPHAPLTFVVTFLYEMLPVTCDSRCNCDSQEKESVLLQLPTSVKITAKQTMLCDPAGEIRHKIQHKK